ncbi:MAG: peptidase fungalysin, partial [Solirubrobacterales bacterium]|nr:peptidase fungalysin [Solirubrobacterales bacterium]
AAGGTGAAGVAGAARDGSLKNSITASNGASGCDPAAKPTDSGGNITFQSGADCPGTAADPGLGPLADNGGATRTMAPALPGPAIDTGVASGCPATDQRTVARPIGACDAGAYEAGATVTTGDATAVTLDSASLPGALTPTLRATSFHFEYGTSTAYGSATPVIQAASNAGTTPVGVTLAGLDPSTTYHYRLVAVSPDATAAFAGADKTFTTAAAPAPQIQQPQQPTTPPSTGGGTTNGPPVRGSAVVSDSGTALVRLDKHNRFKLPGLSFSCPSDASGKCTATITIVAGAHATLTVAPGKKGSATLTASKSLVARVKKKGYVALTAKTTFAAPGVTPVSMKKAFVLLKRGG